MMSPVIPVGLGVSISFSIDRRAIEGKTIHNTLVVENQRSKEEARRSSFCQVVLSQLTVTLENKDNTDCAFYHMTVSR